jgi:hypothetical protein
LITISPASQFACAGALASVRLVATVATAARRIVFIEALPCERVCLRREADFSFNGFL